MAWRSQSFSAFFLPLRYLDHLGLICEFEVEAHCAPWHAALCSMILVCRAQNEPCAAGRHERWFQRFWTIPGAVNISRA